ncbi:MAG TPA: hypothetical protein PLN69_03610 [bacterium]|nr:hypothetical protein [bacterium]
MKNIIRKPVFLLYTIIAAILTAGVLVPSAETLSAVLGISMLTPEKSYFLWLARVIVAHAGMLSFAYVILRAGEESPDAVNGGREDAAGLFAVSFLLLFMELALIRWIPAYVRLMSYFTNFILLACFLGMGLGCLASGNKKDYFKKLPLILFVIIAASLLVYALGHLELINYTLGKVSGSEVYFGGIHLKGDPRLRIYGVTFLIGIIFVLVTLVFIGPGQVMGRMFDGFENPVKAYAINVAASIAGIALITIFSLLKFPAWVWFAVVGLFFTLSAMRHGRGAQVVSVVIIIFGISLMLFADAPSVSGKTYWSPYYRILYSHPQIHVNEIGHQAMSSAGGTVHYNYHMPHLMNRDAGKQAFRNVLVIGAGSGNDVATALRYGAGHVDAVEIDPVIIDIGKKNHMDRPYSDPRVNIVNDDGRSFLRGGDSGYDLIVYGLVDSLTLMSGFSSVRLENYLFTKEAFEDVKRRLEPGGVFVMYNYFRENWLTIRLYRMLEDVFGQEPVLMINPPLEKLTSNAGSNEAMSVFMAGDVEGIKNAFRESGGYKMLADTGDTRYDFNGFDGPGAGRAPITFFDVRIPESEYENITTDDWPFVYLRNKGVPPHNIWGLVLVAVVSVLFLGGFMGFSGLSKISVHFFFLGGAFMLLETESIVKLALIHGSTWLVNSVVFISVLTMIFFANIFVLKFRPRGIKLVYALLLISLAANYFVPLECFLGKGRFVENALSALLLFAPIGFAGIIFAVSFRKSSRPALDLGSNLLGIIAGGIAEYASLSFGYNALILFAAGMYVVSLIALPRYK